MRIQQIRSATVKIDYGGTVFLVDPWLEDKGTGYSVKTVRPKMQGVRCPMNDLADTPENILADVDCYLVTHLHFDHFSPDYLPLAMSIIAQNAEDAQALRAQGFDHVGFFEGDSMVVEGVTIHKTAAVHGVSPAVVEKMGAACGYVFEAAGEKRLYVAGDTIYCREVEQILDEYQPGVIILNCCEATMPIGRLIMGLADVESVSIRAPKAKVIASHLDSVNHALLTGDDVRRFVAERGLRNVVVPHNGETIEI